MAASTVQQTFDLAMRHHRAGQLHEAEIFYRQVLTQQPDHADSLHLLGVIAHQAGQPELAVDLIQHAISIDPNSAIYSCNLSLALKSLNRHEEAVSVCRQVLERHPHHAPAYNSLGNALNHLGRFDEAIAALRRAIELKADFADAYINLANPLINTNRFEEAIDACRKAIKLRPKSAEALANLGTALNGAGRLKESADAYHAALALQPNLIDVPNNLANVLSCLQHYDEAIALYQRALAQHPGKGEIHSNLAAVLIKMGHFAPALAEARKAVELAPDFPDSHFNLAHVQSLREDLDEALSEFKKAIGLRDDYFQARGNIGAVLHNMARLDEAIAAHRSMLDRYPGDVISRNNLIYTLLFHPNYEPEAARQEMETWQEIHGKPLAAEICEHGNDANPDRKLRIGYVSADFREHVIGRNILPILLQHDRSQVEIFCYSDVAAHDGVTARFQALANRWREIAGKSDAEVAEIIRKDRIDLLIDLSLHLSGNQLLVFARKPAPVQVAWAGYPGGTGVAATDYRLTDPRLDPPGISDAFYLQKSYRLPDSFWCYNRDYDTAAGDVGVSLLPAQSKGYVTFGCLNNFCKQTEIMLDLWATVMRQVENSRLLLLAPQGSCREWVSGIFARQNISAGRIEFCGRCSHREFLELHHRIDIVLDTFPYNGHTTSLDALWMGVPTITRFGRSAVSRAGLSQLTNLGLTEFVAETETQFVQIAIGLAHDLPRLAELRRTLRQRMKQSPLTDAKRFARNLEKAFRHMWRTWCADHPSRG